MRALRQALRTRGASGELCCRACARLTHAKAGPRRAECVCAAVGPCGALALPWHAPAPVAPRGGDVRCLPSAVMATAAREAARLAPNDACARGLRKSGAQCHQSPSRACRAPSRPETRAAEVRPHSVRHAPRRLAASAAAASAAPGSPAKRDGVSHIRDVAHRAAARAAPRRTRPPPPAHACRAVLRCALACANVLRCAARRPARQRREVSVVSTRPGKESESHKRDCF